MSVGAIRDFQVASQLKLGIGGLVARAFVPGSLDPACGSDQNGAMGFFRLKIDGLSFPERFQGSFGAAHRFS